MVLGINGIRNCGRESMVLGNAVTGRVSGITDIKENCSHWYQRINVRLKNITMYFNGCVTLFSAINSLTECRITITM